MGIDKSDVRYVIHHSLAKSIEGYYQEAGRAGRDGRSAHCILFYNYSDLGRLRRMILNEGTNIKQHLDNLYRMVQYCENEADCRRSQILEYFAEHFDPETCKNSSTPCDVCRSQTPHHVQDVTSLVCTILEGVSQVTSGRGQFTLVQYMDALRSAASTRPQLRPLPLYGKGNVLSKHDLERLLHMMVMKGFLAEDLQIGDHDNVVCYVKSGPKLGSVLSGEFGSIQLKVKQKSRASVSGKAVVAESEEERLKEECYNALDELRKRIASEQGKTNPEVVLTVSTLRELSQKLPTSKDEMLTVQGLTVAKWKNSCGEEFLKITSEYAGQVAMLPPPPPPPQTISPYFNNENNDKENVPLNKGKRKSNSSSTKAFAPSRNTTIIDDIIDSDDEFEPFPKTKSLKSIPTNNKTGQAKKTKQVTLPRLLPRPVPFKQK